MRKVKGCLENDPRFADIAGPLLFPVLICCAALLNSEAYGQARTTPKKAYTPQSLATAVPTSPNPYVSYLPPGVEPDWDYWRARARVDGAARRQAKLLTAPAPLITTSETENNDTQAAANFITGFGTIFGSDASADLTGSFPAPATPTGAGPFAEDDGSIPLSSTLGLTSGAALIISATLGDGPHGSGGTGNGDFDFYEVLGLTSGQILSIDITTPFQGLADLDSFVAVWDSAGNLLASNDDEDFFGGNFDSFLQFSAPSAGNYYISVGSFVADIPLDPFDSSSGLGFFSEGIYDITIGLDSGDADFFSFEVRAGDVISATSFSAAQQLALFDPSGVLRIGATDDISFLYPPSSPLAGGGIAAISYVAEISGTWALRVLGAGSGGYTVELRSFRPGLESAAPNTTQILFLDFDGASIDTSIFGGPGVVSLSPLTAFLSAWGVPLASENAVISSILDVIEETLFTDILTMGNNPNFAVDIQNSRDDPDPFGQPFVSRVIVGGTIAQSGVATIGIAESIDPGNYGTAESALVLLDLLSAAPSEPASLNGIARGGGATMIDLIGVGVGNIVAHEAGHFFGNWHTDQFNATINIMDQGGNFAGLLGLGPDNIFGTADDIDNDFGVDTFVPDEGFIGIEDTLNEIAYSLFTTSPINAITSSPVPGFIVAGGGLQLFAPIVAQPPYQWKRNVGAGLVAVVDDGRITGATSSVLTFDPVLASDAGNYFITYEDGAAKAVVDSGLFVLTVLPFGSLPVTGLVGLVCVVAALVVFGWRRISRRRRKT